VQDQQAKDAVEVALELKWMRPLRATLFGVSRPLTSHDEALLLQKVIESESISIQSPSQQQIIVPVQQGAVPQGQVLQSVLKLLNDQYLYQNRISSATGSGSQSVDALVKSLNDPYTVFFKPSSAKDFQTQLQGEVTGIGAQVEVKDGVLGIVSPLVGSPAEKAGLQPGDEIISVDGVSLNGLTYEDAVDHVRGPKGTTANLMIKRGSSEFTIAVVRDVVHISDYEISYKGSVAIVALHQFGQSADDEFRTRMQEVAAKQPTGIILDLRNNPGGLLDAAGVVVSTFLPDQSPFVLINTKDQSTPELTNGEPVIPAGIPLVVLVNRGSASAAEIVAGALQDAKRATIVGEKTFGKGTVQQVVPFDDGSSLKMTIAEWRTPKGRKIDGLGVDPDVSVTAIPGSDAPLERGLSILQGR
jgi:carboxyl-terminal processing protease